MARKLISLILCLVLCLSLAAPATANSSAGGYTFGISSTGGSTIGSTVTINVSVTGGTFKGIQYRMDYDPDVLELVTCDSYAIHTAEQHKIGYANASTSDLSSAVGTYVFRIIAHKDSDMITPSEDYISYLKSDISYPYSTALDFSQIKVIANVSASSAVVIPNTSYDVNIENANTTETSDENGMHHVVTKYYDTDGDIVYSLEIVRPTSGTELSKIEEIFYGGSVDNVTGLSSVVFNVDGSKEYTEVSYSNGVITTVTKVVDNLGNPVSYTEKVENSSGYTITTKTDLDSSWNAATVEVKVYDSDDNLLSEYISHQTSPTDASNYHYVIKEYDPDNPGYEKITEYIRPNADTENYYDKYTVTIHNGTDTFIGTEEYNIEIDYLKGVTPGSISTNSYNLIATPTGVSTVTAITIEKESATEYVKTTYKTDGSRVVQEHNESGVGGDTSIIDVVSEYEEGIVTPIKITTTMADQSQTVIVYDDQGNVLDTTVTSLNSSGDTLVTNIHTDNQGTVITQEQEFDKDDNHLKNASETKEYTDGSKVEKREEYVAETGDVSKKEIIETASDNSAKTHSMEVSSEGAITVRLITTDSSSAITGDSGNISLETEVIPYTSNIDLLMYKTGTQGEDLDVDMAPISLLINETDEMYLTKGSQYNDGAQYVFLRGISSTDSKVVIPEDATGTYIDCSDKDIHNDATIDINDVKDVLAIYLGSTSLTQNAVILSDQNRDKVVDIEDTVDLLVYIRQSL